MREIVVVIAEWLKSAGRDDVCRRFPSALVGDVLDRDPELASSRFGGKVRCRSMPRGVVQRARLRLGHGDQSPSVCNPSKARSTTTSGCCPADQRHEIRKVS